MQKTLNTAAVKATSSSAITPIIHDDQLDDFCPTDEEITETERLDVSETVVEAPLTKQAHSQFLEIVDDDDESIKEESVEEELLPLEELIDRLARVSAESSSLRPHKDLTIEEMTNILKHINLCEAVQTNPRWDLIDEMAYESSISYCDSSEVATGATPALFHDDGFSLDAVSHSCSSSVTWYEGSMIEEVELSDNELQELLHYTYESSSGEFCLSAKERCCEHNGDSNEDS